MPAAFLCCAADLFKSHSSISVAELHNSYTQVYNEQKQRHQQQPPQQQAGHQAEALLRPVTAAQLQMAVLQLNEQFGMKSGIITKRQPAAADAAAAVGDRQ